MTSILTFAYLKTLKKDEKSALPQRPALFFFACCFMPLSLASFSLVGLKVFFCCMMKEPFYNHKMFFLDCAFCGPWVSGKFFNQTFVVPRVVTLRLCVKGAEPFVLPLHSH